MKVKKLLSFVLVAAMMLSVFVLPATAVSENEIVVHYYNEKNCKVFFTDEIIKFKQSGQVGRKRKDTNKDNLEGVKDKVLYIALMVKENNENNENKK